MKTISVKSITAVKILENSEVSGRSRTMQAKKLELKNRSFLPPTEHSQKSFSSQQLSCYQRIISEILEEPKSGAKHITE